MANSPCKMQNPKFSYSQIKFPETEIFLARIHLVCQKLIEIIHFLDTKKKKNSFRQQTNNFVKSICFLRPWRRKYFFSREEENVLFKVSLRPARLFFPSSKFYILQNLTKSFLFLLRCTIVDVVFLFQKYQLNTFCTILTV